MSYHTFIFTKYCIDYFLSSHVLDAYIDKMIVDEERNFHLGSDHNVLFLHLKLNPTNGYDTNVDLSPECRPWNISYNQDFSAYEDSISSQFNQWDAVNFNDADSLWNSWKNTLISIALDIVGCKDTKKTGKQWWDKSIDEAIQDRKGACKEHRRWSKVKRGDALWDDYKLKKLHAKKLIQQKINKMRFERSIKIAHAGGPSCRVFLEGITWKEEKGGMELIETPQLKWNYNRQKYH